MAIFKRFETGPAVYFKSTDGHHGDFSLRRLNVHLLALAAAHGGCVLVDSTGRGKRIPDSFSKTVPIWCAVINRALQRVAIASGAAAHAAAATWDVDLHMPSCVPDALAAQFAARLDTFVAQLLALDLDLRGLLQLVQKPLRPLWITPASRIWANEPPDHSDCAFTPVILVTASQHELDPDATRVLVSPHGERIEFKYTPGAGDDHETWARGLTPALFWQHHDFLLFGGAPADCDRRIHTVVTTSVPPQLSPPPPQSSTAAVVRVVCWVPLEACAGRLALAETLDSVPHEPLDSTLYLRASERCAVFHCNSSGSDSTDSASHTHALGIPRGKLARTVFLARLEAAVAAILARVDSGTDVAVASHAGSDTASALVLGVLLTLHARAHGRALCKTDVAAHVARLAVLAPAAQPSRTLLRLLQRHLLVH